MKTAKALRMGLAATVVIATATVTAGCDVLQTLLQGGKPPAPSGQGPGFGISNLIAPDGKVTLGWDKLRRWEATVPVNKETQTASVKGAVDGVKETIKAGSTALSQSASAAMASSSSKYAIASLYQTLGLKTVDLDTRGTKVVYDEASKAVVKIEGKDLVVDISTSGKGSHLRSASAKVSKTPDGSVGEAALAIDASSWVELPMLPVMQLGPGETPPPPPPPPPFEFFPGNQIPDYTSINKVAAKVWVAPKGDQSLRFEAGVIADDFKKASGLLYGFGAPIQLCAGSSSEPVSCPTPDPALAPRVPHVIKSYAKVPGFEYDQTLTYGASGDTGGKISLHGDLNIKTKDGWNSWTITNNVTGDSKDYSRMVAEATWENTTMKYKLVATGKFESCSPYQCFVVDAKVTRSEDGVELATLKVSSGELNAGTYPKLKFPDGSEIELKPQDFLPSMPSIMPPSSLATPPPMAK